VNTAAVKQYEGLKYTDDDSDAFWLAHLLRLGLLPTGYIYPKQSRAVRDLLRKRGQLVRQRTAHILSIENLYSRNTGSRLSCNAIKRLTQEQIQQQFDDPNVALAIDSNRSLMNALEQQINVLEQAILKQAKLDPRYRYLLSIGGIGEILALTIMLETGDIGRFEQVGNCTSYCRCVGSEHIESDWQAAQPTNKRFVYGKDRLIRLSLEPQRVWSVSAENHQICCVKCNWTRLGTDNADVRSS
jgi:transposase